LRVEGSKFRVQGSRFRVQGSRFRVRGKGFRVSGLEFRVDGVGYRVQDFAALEFRCEDSGFGACLGGNRGREVDLELVLRRLIYR